MKKVVDIILGLLIFLLYLFVVAGSILSSPRPENTIYGVVAILLATVLTLSFVRFIRFLSLRFNKEKILYFMAFCPIVFILSLPLFEMASESLPRSLVDPLVWFCFIVVAPVVIPLAILKLLKAILKLLKLLLKSFLRYFKK